ncbi:MAG: hypothetical protein Q7J25_00225 [Vicinamibacterales bacterium]|nr:hypothetical protein [Vicinamibacterales bacterium]
MIDQRSTGSGEPRFERRLRQFTLLIARIALGYLFFSQLFWKVPPHFGCTDPPGFVLTTVDNAGTWRRTGGLCDWIGVESVWSKREFAFFGTDFNNDGTPDVGLNLGPLRRINGAFVDRLVAPHFATFGWLIFLTESAIATSLFLGALTRAGAFLSLCLSVQLALGIAGVSAPSADIQEWEWSYHLMVILSLLLLATPSGRILGLDALLRTHLAGDVPRGGWRKWLLYLT